MSAAQQQRCACTEAAEIAEATVPRGLAEATSSVFIIAKNCRHLEGKLTTKIYC